MELNDKSSILAFLRSRKSASAKAMTGPGPKREELSEILEIAVRVPDHGKLAPWRFVVFEGQARAKVGEAFAAAWHKKHPDHGAEMLDFQRGLFMRAPLIVTVVSTAKSHAKIPVWEQQMSTGALCFNLELAAIAKGFDVQWQSDWIAYDEAAKSAMGVAPEENIAGIIYIGKSSAPLEDRPRPDAAAITTYWS